MNDDRRQPNLGLRAGGKSRAGLYAAVALCATIAAPRIASAADASSAAQDTSASTLAPLVVTARRVEEDIQKVPLTVTALTPEMLKRENITDVNDLTYVSPSLTIATADFSTLSSSFAVRGLPTGVTTYFSDAPCCGTFASIPFMDIARVQVLNGPQGTLFGNTSAAGAVVIDPQHPVFDRYSGLIDLTGGDYGRIQATGVVNIPIIADHLAIRLAANVNHVDGYTHIIGGGSNLDETNNQQYRVGLEFKQGHFDNYLVGQYLNVNETATSNVLDGANPNFSLFNLPAAFGPFVFGATCAQSVSFGLSPDVNTCVNNDLAVLSQIKALLIAESARVAGGGSAVRSTIGSYNGLPLINEAKHADIVDVAQYDFGDVSGTKINVKNIFSFHTDASDVSNMLDGIGGLLENGIFGAGPSLGLTGSNNEVGNHAVVKMGPPVLNYVEEFQIHANTDDGLLLTTLGAFYSVTDAQKNLAGTPTVYQVFGGVLTPNLGYQTAGGFQNGQHTTSKALYGQATLDLSRVGVHGLSVTGGYRYSWDYSNVQTFPQNILYPSGVNVPGAPLSTVISQSSGYNYTAEVSEQATDKLLFYASISRAYVPGGVNPEASSTLDLPDFTPTFGPEIVLDREIGVKYDFAFAGVQGRIDADAYWDSFSDIIEPFTGTVGAASFVYSENVAGAKLNGVEIQATLIPVRPLEITVGYNYNNAYYTNWIGQDPFSVAMPGDPVCLPSSPAGSCLLDLSNNPFEFMPRQQVHFTVRYRLPLDVSLGDLSVSLSGYAQSRVYYEPTAARDIQVLPQDVNDLSQAPYTLLNLRAEWLNIKGSGWNASAFVNNLTNEVYATGKLPQMVTLGFSVANYGPPRMFGIEVSKKFGD